MPWITRVFPIMKIFQRDSIALKDAGCVDFRGTGTDRSYAIPSPHGKSGKIAFSEAFRSAGLWNGFVGDSAASGNEDHQKKRSGRGR